MLLKGDLYKHIGFDLSVVVRTFTNSILAQDQVPRQDHPRFHFHGKKAEPEKFLIRDPFHSQNSGGHILAKLQ